MDKKTNLKIKNAIARLTDKQKIRLKEINANDIPPRLWTNDDFDIMDVYKIGVGGKIDLQKEEFTIAKI